ncbi:hypothetical protein L195_g062388, partial [Trifolium pratense]
CIQRIVDPHRFFQVADSITSPFSSQRIEPSSVVLLLQVGIGVGLDIIPGKGFLHLG